MRPKKQLAYFTPRITCGALVRKTQKYHQSVVRCAGALYLQFATNFTTAVFHGSCGAAEKPRWCNFIFEKSMHVVQSYVKCRSFVVAAD